MKPSLISPGAVDCSTKTSSSRTDSPIVTEVSLLLVVQSEMLLCYDLAYMNYHTYIARPSFARPELRQSNIRFTSTHWESYLDAEPAYLASAQILGLGAHIPTVEPQVQPALLDRKLVLSNNFLFSIVAPTWMAVARQLSLC